jgi:hypothetical protein
MQIPILIEPVHGHTYRARAGEPFSCSAEGETPDEAVGRVCDLIHDCLDAGARLVAVDVPVHTQSVVECVGLFISTPTPADWNEGNAD